MTGPPLPSTPGYGYAADVLAGRVVVGELVRAAVDRAVRDLETGPARGLRFSEAAALRPAAFCSHLKQSKGEWARQPLELSPWQHFISEQVFGWLRADGTRRYRVVYVEIAKKNGKTTFLAGLAVYMLAADGEAGAEVYTAATSRDQACILFDAAALMVSSSRYLASRIQRLKRNLNVPATASKMQPLSSDYNTLDGLNVHLGALDEVHAHPDGSLWDVLETATAARRSPLIFGITTAGEDVASFCGDLHDQADQVVRGALELDSLFAFIAAPDPGDDWRSVTAWQKANPNLGVTVKLDSLVDQAASAGQNLRKENAFRRYRVNQWIAGKVRWINLAAWDAAAGELDVAELEASLAGRTAFAGLDLSSTTDLSALVLVFPPIAPGDPFDVVARFFMPEDRALDPAKSRADRVPYATWCEAGLIIATPGAMIHYGWIRAELEELAERYTIVQIGYDPWNAPQFALELEDEAGFQMVAVRQGYASMSAPSKQFEALVAAGAIRHGGHPVLRWNADNVSIRTDPSGNIKPDKEKSRQRIDGIVALVIGLDRAMRNEGVTVPTSIYATHDMAVL